jgi:ATP-dependent RNA helicase RhlE
MMFSKLGLAEPILRAVVKEGYAQPTPIQAQSIPHLLAGRDVIGSAPTGTGKTAAFSLPILDQLRDKPRAIHEPGKYRSPRPIRALILSPTRELAAQIGDAIRTYGHFTNLRYTVVFGGVGYVPQIQALRRGVDILVATPGRLIDLINQRYVDLTGVEIFVLDEADRMLDMGFIPDIRRIIGLLPAKRQSMLFSATMPRDIEQLARSMLRNPVQVNVQPPKVENGLIEESVFFVPQNRKASLLTSMLRKEAVSRALVFTRTKHGADRVVKHLAKRGIRAEALHGNKTQSARLRTMANFRADRTQVVVATDVAARGIDVDGISHVLNYDLPREPETYVHRIGRTGRAGATGVAVSFCDVEERKHLQSIERLLRRALRVERTETSLPEDEIKQPVHQIRDAHIRSERRTRVPDWQTKRPQRKTRHSGKFGGKKRERLVSSPDQWRRY